MYKNRQEQSGPDKPAQPAGKDNRTIFSYFSPQLWWILFLVLCTSYILKLYFSPGHTYSLDGASHTSQAMMVYDSLIDGELPLWSNRWYLGFPLLHFYPPLFFYITALLNLLLSNMLLSIKLMAFIGHVLSGVTAFLLVEEITDDCQAGFIGGLAFSLAPWHVFQILDFGRHTVIFVYPLLPLPFLFFEKYRNGKLTLPQAGILIGFSLALLISFQYGYAMFATLIFVYYVIVNAVRLRKPFVNFEYLKLLGISGLVCFCLAIAFIVPYLLESGYVNIPNKLLSSTGFNTDSANFSALFTRQDVPDYHKGYIGLSVFVLSLFGVLSALLNKKLPLLIIYGFCFYLVLGHETAFYKYIPFVYTQQATERLIIYLMLFMAIMAGQGVVLLKMGLIRRLRGWIWRIVFLLLAVTCFIDMAVTKDREWVKSHNMSRIYQQFSQNISGYDLPHARTIRFLQACSIPQIDWMFNLIYPATLTIETPASSIRGFLNLYASKGLGFLESGRTSVREDIEANQKIISSQEFLYLVNISYVFYINPKARFFLLKNLHTTPAIASGGIIWQEEFSRYLNEDDSNALYPLIKQLGLNMEHNSARQLLLKNNAHFPPRPFGEGSRLEVFNFEQTTNKSYLEVETDRDCYLQVSHSYYPYLHVYLDEEEVPFYETVFSTIVIPLPTGRHHIRIEPYLSLARKACYSLSLIFLVLAVVFYRHFRHRPEEKIKGQNIS